MKIIEYLKKLFINFPYVLKLIHWSLVLISLNVLLQYESYEIAPWLWIVYCINSITYFLIVSVVLINYVLVKNPEVLDFYFTMAGIPINLTAAIAAIIQEIKLEPDDAQNGPTQLYLAGCYAGISLFMIAQVSLAIFFQKHNESQANETAASNS